MVVRTLVVQTSVVQTFMSFFRTSSLVPVSGEIRFALPEPEGRISRALTRSRSSGVLSEGVADGDTVAEGVPGTELRVVVDQIEARLGADEEASPSIHLDTAAYVPHEMGAAGEALRTGAGLRLKAGVQDASAAHHLNTKTLGQLRGPDGIAIEKHRAKRDVEKILSVRPGVYSYGGFGLYADDLPEEQVIDAARRVGCAVQRLRLVVPGGCAACGGEDGA